MAAEPLPELAAVHWRPRVDARRLRRTDALWTTITVAHIVPFLAAGLVLFAIEPLAVPVTLACLAHAWVIPELYAQRGANVVRPRRTSCAAVGAEERAVGLLGDLIGHEARDLHARTGLVLERAALGVWLLGPVGALLVRPGGRRVLCHCVGVSDPELPAADRIAHLLLALRSDERGFATVANLAFSGARWRAGGSSRARVRRSTPPRLSRAHSTCGTATEPGSPTAGRWAGGRRAGTIIGMSRTAAARVLLVERRDVVAPRDPNAAKVRRYRLARLQLNGRPPGPARYEHLRRSYD